MDEFIHPSGTIDPEVRAHVHSLVTALGGASASNDGSYVLGDDALACLKDIKRWLKLHDEKLNRLDVTRCLAEANLVKGDLLEILGHWPEEAMNEKWKGRIALACVELLVPLTWPAEKDLMSEVTRNQHRHLPYIQVAQVTYKREILEHPSGDLLKKAVRMALPSMAVPGHERTPRDEGIIKLVTYFVRNLAMISATANLPVEWNEQEVSRSATIRAFDRQNILTMLLSMASNVATDFKTQDVIILEVLYHIIKGIDPKTLFMSKPQRAEAASSELKDLMEKEGDLLKTFTKHAPTRHNRFGTMVWIERDESKRSMVSGQDILRGGQQTLDKMDKSKKWNKPRRRPQQERNHMNFDLPESLTDDANRALREFVENFIDSGFNPLFSHLRKAIEREADRVLIAHAQQFWYLISWFLRAETERRKAKKREHEQEHGKNTAPELDSFGIVASVLNQETFVLLNRYMQTQLDNKEWQELDAGMRCFTQILLTVQEMADSPLDEDQEIADNIQNNIFYEETTHDRVLAILRGYKDQNFSYLDATTELSHVFLRLLERYSKENGDLQIRSRRRARKKKTKAGETPAMQQGDENPNEGSEAEDEEQAAKVSRERKFEFNRFALKFTTQNSVNTFVKFLSYYKDLSLEQLKRAHRFLYRVAFKQEMTVLLFRLDIIQLLNRMIKSSDSLHRSHPMFGEFNELVKQIFRRLTKKMKERPELAVELLFSKIPATLHYLEYGYEKQTASVPRAPAELEVRGSLPIDDQIGVVVAALVGEGKKDTVEWVSKILRSAAGERQSWEDLDVARTAESQTVGFQGPADPAAVSAEQTPAVADDAVGANASEPPEAPAVPSVEAPAETSAEAPQITVRPDSAARKLSLFKDARLRLLLKLSGAIRDGFKDDVDAPWTIPSSLSSSQLLETATSIEQHKNNPRATYGELEDNPLSAGDMLKRVAAARPARATGMFGDGEDDEGLDDFLDDGPSAGRSAGDALEELKAKRRRRHRNSSEEPDEETLANRRLARQMKELEKRRKVKSTEFVHESDEDTDDERDAAFFTKERETARKRVLDHDRQFEEEKRKALGGGKSKRKRKWPGEDDDDDNEGDTAKKLRSSDDDDEEEEQDARMSDTDSASSSVSEQSDGEGLFLSSRAKKFRSKRAARKAGGGAKARKSRAPAVDVDSGSDAASVSSATDADAEGEPDDDDDDDENTPMSSQSEPRVDKLVLAETDGNRGEKGGDGAVSANKIRGIDAAGSNDEEDDLPLPTQRRRAARMAVLDDSDDE